VNKTGVRRGSPVTLAISSFPASCLHSSERTSEAAGAPTGRRSGAIACLLVGGRRAVVEQSRCDALSREPELLNPRLGTGEPRVPFPDSDEVGSDGGRPR
jgi:hypothetical protein